MISPKPYFPYGFLVVDQSSYFIFDSGMMEKKEEVLLKLPFQFLDLLEKIGFLPNEIWVKREEVFVAIAPLAERLEIKLNYVKRLKVLEVAKREMMKFFRTVQY